MSNKTSTLVLAIVMLTATAPARTTALRFFWRRSFHPHIAIRVEFSPNACRIVTTSVGPGEFEWSAPDSLGMSVPLRYLSGPILRNDSASVPVAECTQLATSFEKAVGWIQSAAPYGPAPDGSDWMFEVLTTSGHRAASRFSPDSTHAPEVWRAGIEALRLGRALPPVAERYE